MIEYSHLECIENKIMSQLKDFQKATVERIDYLYRMGQNRILVSDEVGLGKTLVARGTIAKFAKLRYEEGDNLVKIVYICSNATIAEQNIEKLRIVKNVGVENAAYSRLSMQHLNIFMQEFDENILNSYIQIIPLTPATSFNINNSQGIVQERALIYAILKRVPRLKRYEPEMDRIFRYTVRLSNWQEHKNYWESQVEICNKKSKGKYISFMVDKIMDYWDDIDDLIDLCKSVRNEEEDLKFRPTIVKFRMIFADISLNRLDPDLVIMDEFQRFKHLLKDDERIEMNKLTSKFFKMDDMRILMLSATPYKMYSTLDEIFEDDEDSHYSEFFELMKFLMDSKEEESQFRNIWNSYSVELKEFSNDNTSFILAKNNAENALYNNICRTERISESQLEDFIDDSSFSNSLTILNEDIVSYKNVQSLLDDIGLNIKVPVDYVKSAPYIMSFMKDYNLKKKIENYFSSNLHEINKMNMDTFWLDYDDIDNYRQISYNNARLKNLMGHVLKSNAEKLLWVPPSMPYYKLKGAFENCEEFTKTLIFSSWEMVPRMISSLVSYEIERRTIGQLENRNEHYFSKNRYPLSRLNFSLKNDRPSQMSLFTLLYPSLYLIDAYNPKDYLNRNQSLNDIEKEIKEKIKQGLDKISCINSKQTDPKWYYLAPFLLDKINDEELVGWWFEDIELLINTNKDFNDNGFKVHFNTLKQEYMYYFNNLGKKPDDLLDVLCDIALASPAVCAYRLYEREFDYDDSLMQYYNQFSMEIARNFINFMNRPESISVVDLCYKSVSDDAYWKNVLKYSKDGNLQAVFDEYVHLLSSGLYGSSKDKLAIINDKLLSSFNLTTTRYDFDTFDSFKSRMRSGKDRSPSLRTHFAVAFTKGRSDDKDINRKKSVRDAFNSPFRPFVLASTSIGQEGLDFHNYCRKIVHWNLPANPIDLEQREGRINRFKCLAIRQNVAKRYGHMNFDSNNIWDELFKKACECEKNDQCSDLIPYWGVNETDDMIKIERIVPMYPFSRDITKYDRLIKILSLYRLTLGQSRQEYLIDNIFRNFDVKNTDFKELFINLSPYYKSKDKNFNDRYVITDEECLEELSREVREVKHEENIIFNDSQSSNFPIALSYCRLTTCDNSNINAYQNAVQIDLTEYWKNLKDKIGQYDVFDELIKLHQRIYAVPFEGCFMDLVRIEMVGHDGFLSVILVHDNIEYSDSLFEYLFENKFEIESELGFEVFWKNKKKSASWNISVFVPMDLNNVDSWGDALNWHIFIAKRFKEVFSQKIKSYYHDNQIRCGDDLRTEYWLALTSKLQNTNLRPYKLPHSGTWLPLILDDIPFYECRLELHTYLKSKQIKTSIVIERDMQELFNYLFDDKDVIEKALGLKLIWSKNKGRRKIEIVKSFEIDNENMLEAIEWHLNTAVMFKKVFHPRIIMFYERLGEELSK